LQGIKKAKEQYIINSNTSTNAPWPHRQKDARNQAERMQSFVASATFAFCFELGKIRYVSIPKPHASFPHVFTLLGYSSGPIFHDKKYKNK
jgi:hypothetical protein